MNGMDMKLLRRLVVSRIIVRGWHQKEIYR